MPFIGRGIVGGDDPCGGPVAGVGICCIAGDKPGAYAAAIGNIGGGIGAAFAAAATAAAAATEAASFIKGGGMSGLLAYTPLVAISCRYGRPV